MGGGGCVGGGSLLSHSKRFKRGKSPRIVQRQVFGVLAEEAAGKEWGELGKLQKTLFHFLAFVYVCICEPNDRSGAL